ncbi:MAG TPA: apolipoprotein N-acyltransferase [Sphingopyxis sp.]|nr:apolipoprotein N-acyltransferase [Sphingopyxis sp.]
MTVTAPPIASLPNRIAAMARRYPKGIAFVLGLISATGFAPLHFWPLSLLALAGWMALALQAPNMRRTLAIGWCFGVGHFLFGLNWIATAFTYQAAMPEWLGWIAVLLLALYLAIYPAMSALGGWLLARKTGPHHSRALSLSALLGFAGCWTLAEWLRSWLFTGFAWNPLSALTLPYAAAPSRWIGTYGTSALVILAAGLILMLAARRYRDSAIGAALLALFTGAALTDQMLDAADSAVENKGGANTPLVTLVQPNIGQAEKWEGAHAAANFAKLAQLTKPLPTTDAPRLILWPEAAIPDYLERGYPSYYYDLPADTARQRLTALMNQVDVMLLGALKLEFDQAGNAIGARNSVMSLFSDGSLGPRYDKSHLVPYGEYLPMRPLLSALGLSRLAPGDLDFWPGPAARTLDLAGFGTVGLQICYEIIFSGQVTDPALRPAFIFNPSNDAWFGHWGPPQHLAQARLRAIEEGLPVLRSTPTGISAIIDASGHIQQSIPMHQAGRIDAHIPAAFSPTLFSRFGNILPIMFGLCLIAAAIAFRRRHG